MRARLKASLLAAAAVLSAAIAGCYPKPKQDSAYGPAWTPDEPSSKRHESELRATIEELICSEDGSRPPGGLSMAEAAEALPHATPETQLAFAEAAAKCNDVAAAAVVYRLVPALLLKRLEPKEIEQAYAFLKKDRAHGLELFRTLLTAERDGVGLSRAVPSELETFRPERVLAATCAELSGITPQFESQLALAERVLARSGCAEERVALLRRSLESTSAARAAACRKIEREKLTELADAVQTAAESDPGERIPSGRDSSAGGSAGDGIVGAIVGAIFSPLTSVGNEPSDPGVLTYPGRLHCEMAAKYLAEAR